MTPNVRIFIGIIATLTSISCQACSSPVQTHLRQQIDTLVYTEGADTVSATKTPEPGAGFDLTYTPVFTEMTTSTATETPSPTLTSTSTPPSPLVIYAAGDIASCHDRLVEPDNGAMITSNMLLQTSGAIFTLGDNSNETGSQENYNDCFGPTWGRLKERIFPAMGNHEVGKDHQGKAYFSYFDDKTGDWGHYSLNKGNWHIVVLNSNCDVGEQGCDSDSLQAAWLRQDLKSNRQNCILAIWHKPLFTTGEQAAEPRVRPFWQILYEFHADVILNGHNHNYERFKPQNPEGKAVTDGIRQFVVGTGGANLGDSSNPLPANELVRNATTFGYLQLVLEPEGYNWQFIAQPGKKFTDSGSASCH
jgi:hypothetical protein